MFPSLYLSCFLPLSVVASEDLIFRKFGRFLVVFSFNYYIHALMIFVCVSRNGSDNVIAILGPPYIFYVFIDIIRHGLAS